MTPPRTDYRALPGERGHVVLYRQTETNTCPGCGGSNWLVGRIMAECARCQTAIPLMSPLTPGITTEGNH
ncbi:hypothetical protein SAMN02927924_01353 [Sphingobium faniae]|nr:hypothetical protein SAMN02927924_01353 [Sphingobium faniae]